MAANDEDAVNKALGDYGDYNYDKIIINQLDKGEVTDNRNYY